MAMTGETAEDEKRITALLVSGTSWILLDNVTALDSSPLSAVLTATIWRGRILGASRIVSVPNDATWVATGNNIRLSSEMARRVIPIRLEPQEERPEERIGFKHDPLLDWARDHRPELVSACISLIRAWVNAGQPKGKKTLGSFERWASVMGGILAHAGIDGFLEGWEALQADADTETEDWKALCEHWWTAHEGHPMTAKDVLTLAKQHDLLLWLWAGRKEIAAQQRLGHALSGMRGRVLGRYCLRSAGRDSATKNAAYRLEPKGDPPTRPQTPETPHTIENIQNSQTQTPHQDTLNTPSTGGVLGRVAGVSKKTPAVDVKKNAEHSEASGVSCVLGCFQATSTDTDPAKTPRATPPRTIRGGVAMVTDLLAQCHALGVTLAPGDNGALRVSPPGVLPDELKAALRSHKPAVLKLLTAPEPDLCSETPCPICQSHERWLWLDGRQICRVCLILDLAPLTLLRQGWPGGTQRWGPSCT